MPTSGSCTGARKPGALHETGRVRYQTGQQFHVIGGGEAGEIELGLQQVAITHRNPERRCQAETAAGIFLDDLVGSKQVEQEGRAGLIGFGNLAEFVQVAGWRSRRCSTSPSSNAVFSARAEQIAQKVVDDQEFEFRVEIATTLGWAGHEFSWARGF